LEGGAMVRADEGICVIDEFDKMNDNDRTAIHEVMEQQTVSISKAGIVATLKARCNVLAAANAIDGRYDSQKPLSENVSLSAPILSRFDVIVVVRDLPNRDVDKVTAAFVVKSHRESHPLYDPEKEGFEPMERAREEEKEASELREGKEEKKEEKKAKEGKQKEGKQKEGKEEKEGKEGKEEKKEKEEKREKKDNHCDYLNSILEDKKMLSHFSHGDQLNIRTIDQDLLKKYIAYANKLQPMIDSTQDFPKLQKVYAKLRQQSSYVDPGNFLCVRHVEAIIRMAEAHAKMHLRKQVIDYDIDFGIRIIIESFIETQKFAAQRSLKAVGSSLIFFCFYFFVYIIYYFIDLLIQVIDSLICLIIVF
jgi:DNA replication licensing factor MCM2